MLIKSICSNQNNLISNHFIACSKSKSKSKVKIITIYCIERLLTFSGYHISCINEVENIRSLLFEHLPLREGSSNITINGIIDCHLCL
jgi:hypothetical protein